MTQKVILGQRPEFIRRKVEVLMPDGSTGVITADFKYRTRLELADYIDGLMAEVLKAAEAPADAAEPVEAPKPKRSRAKSKAAVAEAVADKAPAWSNRRGAETSVKADANNLMEILLGWDLDIPFGREGVEQLCNELPGAVQALLAGYRTAVNQGHLGN